MQHARINNELSIYFTDDYHIFNKEEISTVIRSSASTIWGIRSKEKHCILMISWEKKNSLLLKMTDLKKITEANIKKTKKMIPDYVQEGMKTLRVGGNEAMMVAYHYTKENLGQSARCVLLLHQGTIYNITFFSNSNYISENEIEFENILQGIEIV